MIKFIPWVQWCSLATQANVEGSPWLQDQFELRKELRQRGVKWSRETVAAVARLSYSSKHLMHWKVTIIISWKEDSLSNTQEGYVSHLPTFQRQPSRFTAGNRIAYFCTCSNNLVLWVLHWIIQPHEKISPAFLHFYTIQNSELGMWNSNSEFLQRANGYNDL